MWYKYPWCPDDVAYPTDFSTTMSLTFLVKYLNNYQMDCCEIGPMAYWHADVSIQLKYSLTELLSWLQTFNLLY